jgi:glycosidase
VIKRTKPVRVLADRYKLFQKYYRDYGRVGEYFVTFVDNHDQMHRPYYRLMHGETDCRVAILAVGYLLTSMGIPCIYYGTEQCLDGGGAEDDDYVRETMFGSNWGAFGAAEGDFFNEQHKAYQAIAQIAKIRHSEPVLRYGRQFFSPVSHDGHAFTEPKDPGGVFAYSRILDTKSIVMVVNLDPQPCEVYVAVDEKSFPVGSVVTSLLDGNTVMVESGPHGQIAWLKLQLEPRQIAILKPD